MSAAGVERPDEPQEVRAEGEPVSFAPIDEVRSLTSGIPDRRRLLIEEPEEWVDFWAELTADLAPAPDVPSVDFERQVVIVATMGLQPTGGYAIRIDQITRTGDDLRVVVSETSPGAGCITIQAFTAPATAVTVPRPVGALEFVERSETQDCL